jgi:endonuclease G
LNDIPSIKTSRNVDFNNTNYDRGHLVPAEDMAYDTAKIEATFRWYNVVPQYNTFNRYDWLTWAERKTREFVKKDSVYVITGCIFDSVVRALKPDSVAIPRRMYKLVQSLRTKQILYIVICNNNSKPNCREIKIAELDRLRKYPIPILK